MRRDSLLTGEVTLPELAAYVEHLPSGSAVWCLEHGLPFGWDLSTILLTDLFAAQSGNVHPARAELDEKARAKSALERLRRQRERLNLKRP